MGFLFYFRRRWRRAHADVWALASEHVAGAVVTFIASVVALPMVALGSDMTHEAWTLFLYGIVGPVAFYSFVFAGYWIATPARIDQERVDEIRLLRARQGLSTADLVERPVKWVPILVPLFAFVAAAFLGGASLFITVSMVDRTLLVQVHDLKQQVERLSKGRGVPKAATPAPPLPQGTAPKTLP